MIIVDNGSTDGTDELIEQWQKSTKNMQGILVGKIGLSAARNVGVQNAKGKYIACIDDDAIASQDWLERITTVFNQLGPGTGCIGGKINPLWQKKRPRWLIDTMLTWVSVLDLGNNTQQLQAGQYLFGTNMAFDKDCLENIGGLSEELGRKGTYLLSGEENAVQHQIMKAGYKVYYDPKIVVWHTIPAERLTRRWFLKRAYWQGITENRFQKTYNAQLCKRKLRVTRKMWEPVSSCTFLACTCARLYGYYHPPKMDRA